MKQNHTRAIIFRILTILYVVAVAWLCFANLSKVSQMPRTLFGLPIDKVVHFLMFFPFPILAFLAYDHLTQTPWQALAALISICAIGGIFAGLTEIIQGQLSYRTKDINDFGADCLAIGLSGLLVFVIDVLKMRKKK
jgi:VanZ family protein